MKSETSLKPGHHGPRKSLLDTNENPHKGIVSPGRPKAKTKSEIAKKLAERQKSKIHQWSVG